MGYPLSLAVRYMGAKKRAFVSVGTAFAMLGVTLGVASLAIVMSVTGGFKAQFREKVLGVNSHVLVMKGGDFREYRDVMAKVERIPGVIGVDPFVINQMMMTRGDRNATGVLLKGVDPALMPKVLDLPKHIVAGSLQGMRRQGAAPPERRSPPQGGKPARTTPEGGGEPARPTIEEPTELLPARDLTPDGGYKSKLPDTDVLPEEFDPDPCKSPEQIARMPGMVIGKSLSKQLAAGIGECVTITSPAVGIALGMSSPRPAMAKQFRVIAIFDAGFEQYDAKFVYTDLFEAQAFYDNGDSVNGLEMKVDDIERASEICKEIDKLLANSVYRTMDWMDLNHGLFTALLIQQIGMSIVLGLIIVVAAFTVIATIIMVVLDKKKEIALLKAIGARDDAILRVFLYQGAIIGLVGTTLGLILGYAGCRALDAYQFPLDPKVYFISRIPVLIRPNEFIITGVFAMVICVVSTLFPALYAAHLRPADGLRAE
ncbi:ABC transporter permease [Pendulispora rubella]|uniref:ABC transporter permease n=1 Tax=Pendulispora rubella TaxID=2741070 RepID=A0ABZ2KV56_9BACT